MAKRTLNNLALLITRRVDKNVNDVVFVQFVEDMLRLTLQEIIAEVPHARWLLDEDSISTTSAQQYVTLPSDMDIDAFVTMRDPTNNRKVTRINPEDADLMDPGRDLTGDEIVFWFQRVGTADRLYFLHRPDSTDTLTLIFGNVITDPTSAQTAALPAKYEYGWVEGAISKLYPRIKNIDPEMHIGLFNNFLKVVKRDANSSPGTSEVMISHRPRYGGGGHGPADYDIG